MKVWEVHALEVGLSKETGEDRGDWAVRCERREEKRCDEVVGQEIKNRRKNGKETGKE